MSAAPWNTLPDRGARLLGRLALALTWIWCCVLLLGCGARSQVRAQAAKDLKCPLDRTQVLGEVGGTWFDYTYCLEICGKRRLYFIPADTGAGPDAPRAAEVSMFDPSYRDQMFRCRALKPAGR